MKFIIDVMGGDKGPKEIIRGALESIEEFGIEILLVGSEEEIKLGLAGLEYPSDKLECLYTGEVIENNEDPVRAIRKKKDSSMVRGARLLADGNYDGMLSTGSTGALLSAGLFIIGRIQGIERGAISVNYPSLEGTKLLLDAGANVDSRPEFLLQFAEMGSIYMKEIGGISRPKIGLINIGVEKGKGNKLTKDTYELLEKSDLNFVGNIEARDLLKGLADVYVCDGFIGNIALKVTEGTAMTVMELLKNQFTKNLKTKLAAGLLMPELKELKNFLDYREVGGAPILGVKKPLFKAHGTSDSYAIKNAIKQLIDFTNKDIIGTVERKIKK